MSDPRQERPSPAIVGEVGSASTLFDAAYPKELQKQEHELIQARREKVRLGFDPERLVGVGLSGGGIRSATFCLGVFQALARQKGVLRRIDFLSTVSGGGYFGSFLGRLLGRKEYVQNPAQVEKILQGEENPEILRYLRENGRYLSPNGAGDSLLGGAVLLRNWISIHLVLIILLLGAFLVLQLLRAGLDRIPGLSGRIAEWASGGSIWWSPFIVLPVITFSLWAFPVGWAYWLVEPESRAIEKGGQGKQPRQASREPAHRWRKSFPPWTGLLLALVASLWLTLATWGLPVSWFWGIVTLLALATCAWWRIALRRKLDEEGDMPQEDWALYRNFGLRHRLGVWVTWALVITAGLLIIALIDSLGQTLYAVLGSQNLGPWLAGVASSWTLLAGFARRIAVLFSKGPGAGRPPLPMQWIAAVAALIAVALLLVSLDAASHAIAWSFKPPPGAPSSLVEKKPEDDKALTVEVRRGSAAVLPLSLKVQAGQETVFEDLKTAATGKAPEKEREEARSAARRDLGPALLGVAGTFLLSLLLGHTWAFLNNSSHQSLYSARLTRAYLGASNPRRWKGRSVSDVLPGDDSDLARYWPPPANTGAPIHLINVTINETIDGKSQIQQQDRKGNGMALGPCGLSVNVHHHLLLPFGKDQEMDPVGAPVDVYPKTGFQVFEYPTMKKDGPAVFTGEMLSLGTWVGISGAAFSTGAGAQTSLGLSLLAGLGNVRLGRWWDSGVVRQPQRRRKLGMRFEDFLARVFPVQIYMLDEFLARFPGTARRHWYLSDGGHFENLGGYELVRRRLRTIVIVDAEQDQDYTFGGLSNLIRKARLDFGAEIRFLNEEELKGEVDKSVRPYFGTLEQLRRGTFKDGKLVEASSGGFSQAYAALAWVTYTSPETAPSRLLYIKPTLMGEEPADLLEYHRSHPAFPHESTGDQFFDEAQWESYRRLGEHITEKLFGEPKVTEPREIRWHPRLFAEDVEGI